MKKQKLIFAVLALLVGGANSASAYTTSDLTSAGWTQVTDLSSMNLSDYYFAIVSNDNTDLMVKMDKAKSGQQASNHSMWYMNGKDPIKDNSYLWTLETNNTSGYVGYTIRNVDRPVRVLQTHDGKSWFCRTNWETTSARWTSYDFEVAEGIYSIKTLANGGTNYLGLWTPENGYVSGQELAGNKSGTEIGKFKIYSISKTTANSRIEAAADATSSSPSDLAPSLWGRKTSDYSSDVNLGYYGEYMYLERYRDNVAPQTGDIITKTITNAPNGIHEISVIVNAAWISGREVVGTTVPTVNENSTVVTINGVSKNVPVRTDGSYNPVTLNFTTRVTDGKIDFAIHNNDAAAFWFVWDITDIFHNTSLSEDAIAFPANGEMAADTWYYYDVPTEDDYEFTSSAATTLVYTTDGTQLTKDATGTEETFTAAQTKTINMSEGIVYFKTSEATTLYKYNVGAATTDYSYIQGGETVTVSWADASTNDPGATFAKNGTPTITFNGSAVDIATTEKGFTFTVPAVSANSSYTLSIPANAFGYAAGSTYNEAQNITLYTPAVFDGTYFLKVAATYDGSSEGTSAAVGKYLARGLNYGTHATLDKYGLPVQITTNGNNETTIQAYDTKRYFFHANSYDCYADQASLAATSYFTVTLNNGKLLIHNNSMAAGTYLKYNTSAAGDANIAVFDDGTGNNAGPIIMWTTENASAHATAMQSYKDAQAATAAAAAYASGNYASLNGITTVSALEAELEANYIKGDFVSPSAIESISEKYQGDQPGSGNITETVYSNTINITEPGFYKFSMQAFYRAASNEVTQAMHTNGVDFPPVVLFFGDSETQIKSIYDDGGLDQGIAEGYFETETVGFAPVQYNGKWYTNGQHNSVIIFQKDYYHNDVYFYASEPGEYTYGVKYMGWACANMQWFIYSPESVEITSYAAAADAADYTALQDAIDAYDGATWGFETGEYAPYNNVEAINNIAAAKAINQETVNSKLLVNSLTTKLALTANDGEVSAIRWIYGDYTDDADSQVPLGWTNGDGNTIRISANHTSNRGLEQLNQYMCLNINTATAAIYGETEGYTMPLKGNTVYKLTFSYAGWANTSGTPTIIVTDGNGTEVKNVELATSSIQGNNTTAPWTAATIVFQTNDAGNYKLSVSKTGNRTAFGDFMLKKAGNVTITPANAKSTYVTTVPLDFTDVEGLDAYVATEAASGAVRLEKVGAVPAGTPLMLIGTASTEYSVPVVASASAPEVNMFLAGDGTTPFNGSTYDYILFSDGLFYQIGSGTVATNKAYLHCTSDPTAKGNQARGLRISFGDITGVANVEAASETEVKDGKFFKNGKLVIFKNGKKFNANGVQVK